MKHYLVYGKVNTLDFGIGISGLETHRSPQRSGSFVSVPGMDGDMFIPNNRFDSIKIIYKCFIPSEFMKNWEAFKGLLMSQADDYHMLSDTYHPEYYRMAMLTEAINPEVGTINEYGQFTLTFHCKPNCYLRSGERMVQLRSGDAIYNPTHYGAYPIIRIYGTGTVRIGKNNIIVTKAGTQYIDVDTKIGDAYEGATNRNDCISASSVYGTIEEGSNTVTLTGVTRIEVIPRWWTV